MMKVLIPLNETHKGVESTVGHLDNSEFVCIYDQEINQIEIVPLYSISTKIGNLSIEMKRKGIEKMICSSIPSLAYDLFSLMGISILQSTKGSLKENLVAFEKSGLTPIAASSHQDMSRCSVNSCASCSSAC